MVGRLGTGKELFEAEVSVGQLRSGARRNMKQVRDWQIQTAWWASGIFATGAVWYFLSVKNPLAAGICGLIAFLIAAFAVHLHIKKDGPNKQIDSTSSSETADTFVRRYREEPSHIRFIKYLPQARRLALAEAQEGWDTGVTMEMRQSSYNFIDFLESSWLRLAEFYPANQFGTQTPREFISDYIQRQFQYHWAKHEPDGPGTGGTIVGVLAGSDVIRDLERMIEDLVTSLFGYDEEFDAGAWSKNWRSNESGDA